MEREKVRGIERVIVRRESIVNVDGPKLMKMRALGEKVNELRYYECQDRFCFGRLCAPQLDSTIGKKHIYNCD
jgi:hypothetical protein